MKISELFQREKTPISFEIFPPKGELTESDYRGILTELKVLNPNFVSVTYSAGGSGNGRNTIQLAEIAQQEYGFCVSAHLTCRNASVQEIKEQLYSLKEAGIDNVLALRGDPVEGKDLGDFTYASELIPVVKEEGFCVGAACYTEGHIECESLDEDIRHLKEKQDAGADFFITQLFFDNRSYYDFMERAQKIGISRPVIPGIMPFLGKSQVSRMIFMCGASLPASIIRILNRYEQDPESLRKAGIDYAAKQIEELLANGAPGAHIYTMNQPDIAKGQIEYLRGKGYGSTTVYHQ